MAHNDTVTAGAAHASSSAPRDLLSDVVVVRHFPSSPSLTSSSASNADSNPGASRSMRLGVLDGGFATHVEDALGMKLPAPLWSAALLDPQYADTVTVTAADGAKITRTTTGHEAVRRTHEAFARVGGARIVETASYQASLPSFRKAGYAEAHAAECILSSVDLAAQAASSSTSSAGKRRPLVALSLGPYGAYLEGGREYTGDYALDGAPQSTAAIREAMYDFHLERLRLFAGLHPLSSPHSDSTSTSTSTSSTAPSASESQAKSRWAQLDLLMFETLPRLDEAQQIRRALGVLRQELEQQKGGGTAAAAAVHLPPAVFAFVFPEAAQAQAQAQPSGAAAAGAEKGQEKEQEIVLPLPPDMQSSASLPSDATSGASEVQVQRSRTCAGIVDFLFEPSPSPSPTSRMSPSAKGNAAEAEAATGEWPVLGLGVNCTKPFLIKRVVRQLRAALSARAPRGEEKRSAGDAVAGAGGSTGGGEEQEEGRRFASPSGKPVLFVYPDGGLTWDGLARVWRTSDGRAVQQQQQQQQQSQGHAHADDQVQQTEGAALASADGVQIGDGSGTGSDASGSTAAPSTPAGSHAHADADAHVQAQLGLPHASHPHSHSNSTHAHEQEEEEGQGEGEVGQEARSWAQGLLEAVQLPPCPSAGPAAGASTGAAGSFPSSGPVVHAHADAHADADADPFDAVILGGCCKTSAAGHIRALAQLVYGSTPA